MDRLESQNINPYTVPGLLPGLLGIVMMLLGGAAGAAQLAARRAARRRAALAHRSRRRRGGVALVLGLCVVFGVVLVGHGLPFWLAAAIFVTRAIVALQRPQRARRRPRARRARRDRRGRRSASARAASITLVFQQLFLVRLP